MTELNQGQAAPQTIDTTLAQRGQVHGGWSTNSQIATELRTVVRRHMHQDKMVPECEEALNAIIGKISRILAGDPHFADHWHDIAGYATLAEKWLNENYGGAVPLSPEAKAALDSLEAVPHADPNSGIPGLDELKPKINRHPLSKVVDTTTTPAPGVINNPYSPRGFA